MIAVNRLTMSFGARDLFRHINFVISAKERVALVGKNGAGKSTLMRILAGKEEPTEGNISRPKELNIGYLPQVMKLSDNCSVRREVEKVFGQARDLERELRKLEEELAARSDYESEEYAALVEHFAHINERWSIEQSEGHEGQMVRTLLGLGFEMSDLDRATSEFSGGWRMRIELAKILLAHPDLLLLDEPTNHLDIESIEWLEQFIKQSGVTLVLISHDRTFVDATCTRTLELELGNLYDYKTNYSHYLSLRQERIEQQRRAWENQQRTIEDIEQFVERFRYKATKAVQVQSRLKQLEKIERIEIEEVDRSAMHFRFPDAPRSGDFPLIIDDLSKAYDEHLVFSQVSLTLRRGEKVAFVGKNGAGKSTLVKCIMGQISDYTGSLRLGHGVEVAYFSQNRAQELDERLTVRETVDRAARGDIRLRIDSMLGAFMFGGELGDKPVAVLSGGERSRLAILLLLLEPANLLVLDEPTNHLDMRSKEVLKEAIKHFTGTVVVVSHDRDFLDSLVEKVYEFADGRVREYIGGIFDYLETRRLSRLADLERQCSTKRVVTPESGNTTTGVLSYEQQKEQSKERRKLERAAQKAEERVTQLEEQLASLEQALTQPDLAADSPLFKEYEQCQQNLATAMEAWEIAASML